MFYVYVHEQKWEIPKKEVQAGLKNDPFAAGGVKASFKHSPE